MMSFRNVLLTAAAAASFAIPLAAPAQQAPAQQVAAPAVRAHRHRGLMRRLRALDLSPAQQQRITALVQAYREAHPKGSPRDPRARKQLRRDVLAVLTPEQRERLRASEETARP